jgi:hypothetical protein
VSDNHILGTMGELKVQWDLLSRGYRVYALVEPRHHPDLWCLDKQGDHFSIEVRTVRTDGRREKKPTDNCDVYAWIDRDGGVEYEPPLWQQPEGIQ